MPGRLRFLDFSQNNSCWLRIDFSPVRMFAAAVFPILNISASFLHPKFGLPLAKSKTSPFHQAIKSFCSVYQQAGALKVTYLWQLYFKISICQCLHIKFRQREYCKLTFDFMFDCKKIKIHGLLLWNSNKHVDLWDFVKKHWWENQHNCRKRPSVFI